MSAPTSHSHSIKRKPPPVYNKPEFPATSYGDEHKENNGPKVVPPPSSSPRLQGSPMTPFQVNFLSENWPPRASSAQIEGGENHSRHVSAESGVSATSGVSSMSEGSEQSEFQMPKTQNANRYSHMRSISRQVAEPQMAVLSSGESTRSPSPSNASWSNGSRREGAGFADQPVPRLQYHHQSFSDGGSGFQNGYQTQHTNSPPLDRVEAGASINRHLTPNSQARRTPIQRPYSTVSDMGPRSRSPGYSPGPRAPSANSGRSWENRPMSYIDLANVQYPQAPPAPMTMDNSQLRSNVGTNASLLSMSKTLAMYRENVKKMEDQETQYSFALFLVQCAQELGLAEQEDPSIQKRNTRYIDGPQISPAELRQEAKQILQKLADKSYTFAQYYLADGYASGLFNKGKEDYSSAFHLFVSASKHGHAESGYRAALCYEYGWGCKKDPAKAVQFFRQSASKNHPGAMTRLGRACLSGDLGMNKYREGLKWLNRATEAADQQYNAAPYHLGLLYETGYGEDVFKDEDYAAKLFTQAADLGHAEASYRMGDAYEHGKLSCPRDPALSVHFYTCAAERGHPAAMMALCAWYMVGAEPVLEKDENEAYEWARKAAECGLTKAEYAVGYFTEMGIGCRRDILEANVWYVKAADAGDERAKHRLAAIREAASGGGGAPMQVAAPRVVSGGKVKKRPAGAEENGGNDKECILM